MGLLDNWLPDDPAQNQAARMGLLNLGAALLGNRSPNFGVALGQGAAAGLEGYQNTIQTQQKQKLMDAQLKTAGLDYDIKKLAYDQAEARRRALQKINSGDLPQQIAPPVPSSPANSVMYQAQMQPAWLQATQPAPQPTVTPSQSSAMDNHARLIRIARVLEDAGDVETAQKYYDSAEKFKDKLKEQKVLKDQSGKLVLSNVYEDGRTVAVPGFLPAEKLHFANTGGETVGLDPYSGQRMAGIRNTLSPDAVASNALGWSRLNFDKSQADKPQLFDTPQGVVGIAPQSGKVRAYTDGQGQAVQGLHGQREKDVRTYQTGIDAVSEAEKLLPHATHSGIGYGLDLAAQGFGYATGGAKATAALDVVGAKLVANVPRFEGPQSNADVQGYKQAAGDVANPTKPIEVRQAALEKVKHYLIKDAQQKGLVPPQATDMAGFRQASPFAMPVGQSAQINGITITRTR